MVASCDLYPTFNSKKSAIIKSCQKLSILTLQNKSDRESGKSKLLLDHGASAE